MIRATFPKTQAHHGNDFNDFAIQPGPPSIFLNTGIWLSPPFDVDETPRQVIPQGKKEPPDPFTKPLAYPDLASI